ncbi:MAG: hypothetical protein ACPF8V_08515, partial [Luteibaculum sp.]
MKKIAFFLALAILISCKDDNKNGQTATDKGAGTLAADILSDSRYKSLTVEILYPEGFEPEAASLDNLRNFILSNAKKPDG